MIILGDFPPSSKVTLLIFGVLDLDRISLPTAVLPVKLTLSTKGWLTRAYPTSPYPVKKFTTPSGKPASWINSAILRAVRGACSAGFMTAVQPVANRGPSFQHRRTIGKFQA
jgi:hypothetical protein